MKEIQIDEPKFPRKDRVGHVFQGRCKAILCDNEAYLLDLACDTPAVQRRHDKSLGIEIENESQL